MTEPFFYRPPFLKHLHNLVVNGFYARDLDADDFAFLEYVKHHGVANGSLPSNSAVLLEELEFWQLPYGIAPDIERHIGRPARPIMTAEQRATRRAQQNAWHARRVIREQERAIAEAELERERREYEKAKKTRQLRALLADAEWEAAAPHNKAKFGKTVKRHYVPQWKLDEEHQKKSAKKKAKAKQRKRERLEEAAKAAERDRQIKEKAAQVAAELEQRAQEAVARAVAQDQERQRREQVIEEARQTVDRLRNDAVPSIDRTADELKQDIITLLRGSQITGHVWTRESIMRATGCDNNEFLDRCLDELVCNGRLRKVAA